MKKNWKLISLSYLIFGLVVANSVLWTTYLTKFDVYAIANNGETICQVQGKDTANTIISETCGDLTDNVKAVESSLSLRKSKGKCVSADEAKKEVVKAVAENSAEVKVASVNVSDVDYTPEPEYVEDDTMLAGQSAVEEKAISGKKEVTTVSVNTNGESTNSEVIKEEILEEGESAVIRKGTRGLPDGEDWKSYEGYPVYKNGSDIVETAKSYIGKVPYVWGGKDLNKGVDCSGFIIALYRLYGINLTYPLYKQGIEVPYSEAKPGDILYFPGHYGMYIGNGKMVHASNPRTDVCIGSVAGRKLLCVTRIVP